MAGLPNSPSNPTVSSNNDTQKRNLSPLRHSSSSKRVKCVKDQVFDEGICDLDSRKTCHQCRQKSSFLVASCKNQRKGKLCPFNFCSKCLFNRYGEKAEDVGLQSDWKCPKCRDICNCSCCMKKKGKDPTGVLSHTAKATGYSSVSEMLIAKKSESLNFENAVKDAVSSPVKLATTKKEMIVPQIKKSEKNSFGKCDSSLKLKVCNKENNFAGKVDPNLKAVSLSSVGKENAADCKRKANAADNVNGKACLGKEELLEEKISKKLKGLKERNLNILKNEDAKVEKKDHNVVAEMESKTSKVVKESSAHPIKAEVKNSKFNKMTEPQLVIPKKCIKKDEIVSEERSSQLDDKKKKPESGINDNNQALTNATNSDKMEVVSKEKSLQGFISSKVPSILNENRLSSKEEEKKGEANDPLSEGTGSQVQKLEEVFQGCVPENGRAVEGCSLLQVDEKSALCSGKTNPDQTALNQRPAICENAMKVMDSVVYADIPLPEGTDLTNVAGIDLPAEDVGPALQFLEFCTAFGKFFHLMKGQPEAILRELIHGPTTRTRRSSSQNSPVVQFHIQLLSLLLRDSGEKSVSLSPTPGRNSWLQALDKCISDSECPFDDLPSNCFNKDGSGYHMLDFSMKLRLLNFLCDEALCTADLRTWIDEQHFKILEKEKGAREKVLIAKDKEKRVKQQMQDELQKATITENPLSISERDELISKMRIEAENAHSEVLEAMKKMPEKKQRSGVLRTDCMLFDGKGHVFWKLKGYSGEPDILVQDIGHLDSISSEEKWFAYDVEQKGMVENYISSRGKRVKLQKSPSTWTSETCGEQKVESK